MEKSSPDHHLPFLKLIAHDVRWEILVALATSDLRVHEITQQLGQPQNLVSYHLQKLKQAALILENHSQADARSIYYRLNYKQIQDALQSVGAALFPIALSQSTQPRAPVRVLFVCTYNSARSQIAEGLLRTMGSKRVQAFSAGSEPKPVHELAVRVMQENNVDIRSQRSKGLETVTGEQFDYIVTVCDRARENCPVFPGKPVHIHWSIPDPASTEGSDEERLKRFRAVADQLTERVQYFLGPFA